MSFSEDLQIILDWGTESLVQFNASKTHDFHTKNPILIPFSWTVHLSKIRNNSILLALLLNMIAADTDTLLQLPHQLLKSLDFSFGLKVLFFFESVYSLRIPNKTLSGILFSRLRSGTTFDTKYPRFHPEESHPTYWWPSSYWKTSFTCPPTCCWWPFSLLQIFPPLVLGRVSFYYSPIGCP